MAEFFAEEGIGETRIVRIEQGRIVQAWLDWYEPLTAGSRVPARIVQRTRQDHRALAETATGETILLRQLPPTCSEGSTVMVEILRAPIREGRRGKPAHGRPTDQPERRWTLLDRFRAEGNSVQTVRRFPVEGWDDVVHLASTGQVDFSGGSLILSPTPAMTLIDIDGHLPAPALAMAAVPAIAGALSLLDLNGSIGIDFPTLATKADRQRVDAALSDALRGYSCERTAMNGFGFVQLVGRVEGPSILHRFASSRTGACARTALRRAEGLDGPGVTLLTVHPALKAKLRPEWLAELERRTARPLRLETDAGLALEAASAQIVPHD